MHSTNCIFTLILSTVFFFSAASAQMNKSPKDSTATRKQMDSTGRPDTLQQVTGKSPADTSSSARKTDQKSDPGKERSSTTRTVERQTATHAQKNAPRVKNSGTTNK